jgi:hypothetical protein
MAFRVCGLNDRGGRPAGGSFRNLPVCGSMWTLCPGALWGAAAGFPAGERDSLVAWVAGTGPEAMGAFSAENAGRATHAKQAAVASRAVKNLRAIIVSPSRSLMNSLPPAGEASSRGRATSSLGIARRPGMI